MHTVAVRGADAASSGQPRSKEEVRAHASAAFEVALTKAELEMRSLLVLISRPTSARVVEPRARSAMEAVSMLWETAARLSEH